MEEQKTDIKSLALICLVFWAAFFLSALVCSYFIGYMLLLVFISSLIGASVAMGVFVWALGKVPTKKDQLTLSRLCTFSIVLLQIPLFLYNPEQMDLIFSGIYGILVILLLGSMTLVVYYGFLRVSFDFFGAVARRKQEGKKQ